jgi:hypothetical protein
VYAEDDILGVLCGFAVMGGSHISVGIIAGSWYMIYVEYLLEKVRWSVGVVMANRQVCLLWRRVSGCWGCKVLGYWGCVG